MTVSKEYLKVVKINCPRCGRQGATGVESGIMVMDENHKTHLEPKGIEARTCSKCGFYNQEILYDVAQV